jgi:hypothetical protein
MEVTRAHFAFRIDMWDANGENIVEHQRPGIVSDPVLSDLMYSMAEDMTGNITCTCPPSMSVNAAQRSNERHGRSMKTRHQHGPQRQDAESDFRGQSSDTETKLDEGNTAI